MTRPAAIAAAVLLALVAPASAGALPPVGPPEQLPGTAEMFGKGDFGGIGPDGTLLLPGFADSGGRRLLVRPPDGPAGAPQPLPAGLSDQQVNVAMGPRGDAVLWTSTALAYRPEGGAVGAPQPVSVAPAQVRLNQAGAAVLLAQGAGNTVVAMSRPAGADSQWDSANAQTLGTGSVLALALDPDGRAVALWIAGTRMQQAVRAAGAATFGAPTDLPLPAGLSDSGNPYRAFDGAGAAPSGWTVAVTAATTGAPGASAPTDVIATVRPPGGTFAPVQSIARPVSNFQLRRPAINDLGGSLVAYFDESPSASELITGTGASFSGPVAQEDSLVGVVAAGDDLAAISVDGSPLHVRLLRFTGPSAAPSGEVDFEDGSSAPAGLVGGPGGGLAAVYTVGNNLNAHTLRFAKPEPRPSFEVEISPVASASAGASFPLTLTLRNTSSSERLEGITPAYPHGFGVANSYYPAAERGEIAVVSGPEPAFPQALGPGESSVHTVMVRATAPGKVGLEAKLAARGAGSGAEVGDTHYGEVAVAEKQPLQAERTAMVASGVALFLGNANRALRDAQARYARELFKLLKSKLSAKARRFYFGSKGKLKVTGLERALARWRNQSPDLAALVTPNKRTLYEGGSAYLTERQFARYQELEQEAFIKKAQAFMAEGNKSFWAELRYWGQFASEEGQGQLAADWALYRELNKQDGDALLSAIGRSFTGAGLSYALGEGDLAVRRGFAQIVGGLLKAREARVERLAKLAESDPDKFIGQLAQDDAQLRYGAFRTLADQLLGDVQDRFQGQLLDGAKGAFAWLANATKLTNKKEARALARSTLISERSATLGPSYMDALSDDAKSMINLRRMEAIGGMPVEDVEITKGIVAQVNARLKLRGHDVEAEALFRPANPFKVPGAYAKVETVGVKNIAPIDLVLGAPPSLLAETAIFKPTHPTKLPGFDDYPEAEKILLRERYEIRLDEYTQFHGPRNKVTDKKMKAMLKAFDDVHTFDEIGKGRTIKMKLSKQEVEGATVLKYDYLQVEGKTLIDGKGKPRSIGTDYDGAALIDKNTRKPLTGQALTAAEFEFKRLGEKAAQEKGYANPFHGFTAHGTDVDAAEYPFVAHYWLRHLKEADAIREAQSLAANYNRGKKAGEHVTAAQLLVDAGGLFERHLLRVSASDASFGPANVVFRTPVVAPR